jgi:hypothetical protein
MDTDDRAFLGFRHPDFREGGGLPWFCGLHREAAAHGIAAETGAHEVVRELDGSAFTEGEGKRRRGKGWRDGVDGGVPERQGIRVLVRSRTERQSECGEVAFVFIAMIWVETDAFRAGRIREESEAVDAVGCEVAEGIEKKGFESDWVEVVGELIAWAVEP